MRNTVDTDYTAEWILTNRLGGYALGSAHLINIRKYHGLLTASDEHFRRIHLVSSIEEKFGVDDEFLFMDSNSYADTIYPQGYLHIAKSRLRPYPAFLYSFSSCKQKIIILKEILMDEWKNITLLKYTNLGKVTLEYFFRYKFSLRNHHHVNSPKTFDIIPIESDIIERNTHRGGWVIRGDTGASAFVYASHGRFKKDPLIFRNIFYPIEDARGYDAAEDLIAPFLHKGFLKPGKTMVILFSDISLEGPAGKSVVTVQEKIGERYSRYALPKGHPSRVTGIKNRKAFLKSSDFKDYIFSEDEYKELLGLLLDDFKTRNDIIAGFPWFSAWGRDTMISLKAYLKQGDNTDFVYDVLNTYGERTQNGLLPNVIGEDGKGTNFDTVDASLWFIIRVYECFEKLGVQRKRKLLGFCADIVLNYIFNKELPFYFDKEDFLISIRDDTQSALTWMDAKVGGIPVTPRYGKPVEINALWFNSVKAVSQMAQKLHKKKIISGTYSMTTEELSDLAEEVGKNMAKFLVDGIWCDRIEKGVRVKEIRPNFVISCSFPFDFTDKKGLKLAAGLAREYLLTPFGLRSLSPESPLYKKNYAGSQEIRDLAYHQGTVWTWLLLPYAQLLEKIIPDKTLLKRELEDSIFQIRCTIMNGTLASAPEVWDGENPHVPKGTPAQAWSVAALFCIEKMIEDIK